MKHSSTLIFYCITLVYLTYSQIKLNLNALDKYLLQNFLKYKAKHMKY